MNRKQGNNRPLICFVIWKTMINYNKHVYIYINMNEQ